MQESRFREFRKLIFRGEGVFITDCECLKGGVTVVID